MLCGCLSVREPQVEAVSGLSAPTLQRGQLPRQERSGDLGEEPSEVPDRKAYCQGRYRVLQGGVEGS